MKTELLDYYNQELTFIRRLGNEFAKEHPKIAGRLRMGQNTVEDPHVARMIEAFALSNAKIRHKLDDSFPELIDAILDVIAPHYRIPIPSMSIVQLKYNQDNLQSKYEIPNQVELITEGSEQTTCRFTTCYATTLYPMQVEQAKIMPRPFTAPSSNSMKKVKSCLQLHLKASSNLLQLKDLGIDSLRFYINAQPQHAYLIYELLFGHCSQIALARNAQDSQPIWLSKEHIKQIGFANEEGILPYPPQAFSGYRLLTEWFTFPEKFLFFELRALDPSLFDHFDNEVSLFIYTKEHFPELEKHVNHDTFKLGCTPIVNLFKDTAAPIIFNQQRAEYPVIPDPSYKMSTTEIYSVEAVNVINSNGKIVEYQPYYSHKHDNAEEEPRYWHISRRTAWQTNQNITEAMNWHLSLVDLEGNPKQLDNYTVNVDLLCTNSKQAERLPFAEDQLKLSFIGEYSDFVSDIICMTPMSKSIPLTQGKKSDWQLVSHLSLNYLTLDGSAGINALRELLNLYAYREQENNDAAKIIDSLKNIVVKRKTARHPHGAGSTFWQGSEITLTIDESRLSGSGAFAFATVLEYFFALYSSINSFTQLTLISEQRGELYQWKPREGEQVLL